MLRRHILAVIFLSLIFSASACDDKKPARQGRGRSLTVRGLLTRSVGIGGETTGWLVVLDQSIEVEGKKLNTLEVEFDSARWPMKEDTQVEATGRIAFRTGVERGRYPVLRVDSFKIVPSPRERGRLALPSS